MSSGVRAGSVYFELTLEGLEQAKRAAQQAGQVIQGELARIKQGADPSRRALDEIAQSTTRAAEAGRQMGRASDEQRESIRRLRDSVSTLRNQYELGDLTKQQFIDRTRALQGEIRKEISLTAEGSKEQAALYRALGTTARGLDTAEGKLSKLGLSQQVNIGFSKALTDQFSRMGPAGRALAMIIDNTGTIMGRMKVETTGAELGISGLTNAKRLAAMQSRIFQTSMLASVAATAVLAGGMALLINRMSAAVDKAAEYADELDKMSQRSGISTDALQEMRFVADQTGVSFDSFQRNVEALTRRLPQLENLSTANGQAFQRLGVDLRDTEGNLRGVGDISFDVMQKLAGMRNETDRNVLASQLFGRASAEILPILALGADGIEQMRAKARELGLVMSGDAIAALVNYKDAQSALNMQQEALTRQLAVEYIPLLQNYLIPLKQTLLIPALRAVVGWVSRMIEGFTAATDEGEAMRASMASVGTGLYDVGQIIVLTGDAVGGLAYGFLGMLQGIDAALEVFNRQLKAKLLDPLVAARDAFQAALRGDWAAVGEAATRPVPAFAFEEINLAFGQASLSSLEQAKELFEGVRDRIASFNENSEEMRDRLTEIFEGMGMGLAEARRLAAALTSDLDDMAGGPGGGSAGRAARTIKQVFEDLGQAGTLAERKAAAWGNTLEAQAESLRTRIGLLKRAFDELLGRDDASDAELENIKERILARERELAIIEARLRRGEAVAAELTAIEQAQLDYLEGEREKAEQKERERQERIAQARVRHGERVTQQLIDIEQALYDWHEEQEEARVARQAEVLAELVAIEQGLLDFQTQQDIKAAQDREARKQAIRDQAAEIRRERAQAVLNELLAIEQAQLDAVEAARQAGEEKELARLDRIREARERNSQRILDQLLFIEGQQLERPAQATEALEEAQANLNRMMGLTTPIDAQRAALAALAKLYPELKLQIDELLASLDQFDKTERFNEALRAGETATREVERALSAIPGTGVKVASAFDVARRVLIEFGEAAGLTEGEVEELLYKLGKLEEEAAQMELLGQISSGLREIGSSAGGPLGEVITGFADLIDVGMKFASGDYIGGTVALLSELVGGFTAASRAAQTLEDRLESIRERTKGIMDSAQFAQTKRDIVGRIFFLPVYGDVINETASRFGLSIAESIADGVASGLKNGMDAYLESGNIEDLQFGLEEGIYRGVSDALYSAIIESAVIEGMLGPRLQALTAAMIQGNTGLAASILADIKAIVPELAATIAPMLAGIADLKPTDPKAPKPGSIAFAQSELSKLRDAFVNADSDAERDRLRKEIKAKEEEIERLEDKNTTKDGTIAAIDKEIRDLRDALLKAETQAERDLILGQIERLEARRKDMLNEGENNALIAALNEEIRELYDQLLEVQTKEGREALWAEIKRLEARRDRLAGDKPATSEADMAKLPPAIQFAVATPLVEASRIMLEAAHLMRDTFSVTPHVPDYSAPQLTALPSAMADLPALSADYSYLATISAHSAAMSEHTTGMREMSAVMERVVSEGIDAHVKLEQAERAAEVRRSPTARRRP